VARSESCRADREMTRLAECRTARSRGLVAPARVAPPKAIEAVVVSSESLSHRRGALRPTAGPRSSRRRSLGEMAPRR
jgi:hypothetical protein